LTQKSLLTMYTDIAGLKFESTVERKTRTKGIEDKCDFFLRTSTVDILQDLWLNRLSQDPKFVSEPSKGLYAVIPSCMSGGCANVPS
jgi:hypothetical protein